MVQYMDLHEFPASQSHKWSHHGPLPLDDGLFKHVLSSQYKEGDVGTTGKSPSLHHTPERSSWYLSFYIFSSLYAFASDSWRRV